MNGRLVSRNALVTGASAGIGRAVVLALLREGANVLATGRRQSALEVLREEAGGGQGSLRISAGDLTEPRYVRALAQDAGEVDILVHNAGILSYGVLLDASPDDTEAMFRTNVLASLQLLQEIARGMVMRRRGHLIVMGSGLGRRVAPLQVVYAATKHALAALTRGLRMELAPHSIRVTEISPGSVETGIRDSITDPAVIAAFNNRRYEPLSVDEVAEAVVYAATAPDNCCVDLLEVRPQGMV